MNVLIDGRPIRMPLSGVAQYVINLARSLGAEATAADRFKLLTFQFRQKQPIAAADLPGIELAHHSVLHRTPFSVAAEFVPVPLAEWLHGRQDVLHLTFFARLRPRRGTAVVSTIHDVIPLDHPEWFTRRNLIGAMRNLQWQVENSDALIADSEYTARRVAEKFPSAERKMSVIHLAADDLAAKVVPSVAEQLLRKHHIDRPFFLYVGNLEPRKNVDLLIEAFVQSKLGDRFQLVISGKRCWGYERIDEALARHPSSGIITTGFISDQEKACLLSRAYAYVYPSRYEGFGIPLVEAMSCGCPVLAADNTSISEVVGQHGLLFRTNEVEALRDSLTLIASEPKLREDLVAAGLRRAAEFTWTKTAAATLAVYRSVT